MRIIVQIILNALSKRITNHVESIDDTVKKDMNLDYKLQSISKSSKELEIELKEFCERNPDSVMCNKGHKLKWR